MFIQNLNDYFNPEFINQKWFDSIIRYLIDNNGLDKSTINHSYLDRPGLSSFNNSKGENTLPYLYIENVLSYNKEIIEIKKYFLITQELKDFIEDIITPPPPPPPPAPKNTIIIPKFLSSSGGDIDSDSSLVGGGVGDASPITQIQELEDAHLLQHCISDSFSTIDVEKVNNLKSKSTNPLLGLKIGNYLMIAKILVPNHPFWARHNLMEDLWLKKFPIQYYNMEKKYNNIELDILVKENIQKKITSPRTLKEIFSWSSLSLPFPLIRIKELDANLYADISYSKYLYPELSYSIMVAQGDFTPLPYNNWRERGDSEPQEFTYFNSIWGISKTSQSLIVRREYRITSQMRKTLIQRCYFDHYINRFREGNILIIQKTFPCLYLYSKYIDWNSDLFDQRKYLDIHSIIKEIWLSKTPETLDSIPTVNVDVEGQKDEVRDEKIQHQLNLERIQRDWKNITPKLWARARIGIEISEIHMNPLISK